MGFRKGGKVKLLNDMIAYCVVDLIEQTKNEIIADLVNNHLGHSNWNYDSLKDRTLTKTMTDRSEEFWFDNEHLLTFGAVDVLKKLKKNQVVVLKYTIKKPKN